MGSRKAAFDAGMERGSTAGRCSGVLMADRLVSICEYDGCVNPDY